MFVAVLLLNLGPVCDIALAGCDLSFFFQQQTHCSAFTSKSIQPFHKHLYYTSQKKDGEKQTSAIPIMARRGHSVSVDNPCKCTFMILPITIQVCDTLHVLCKLFDMYVQACSTYVVFIPSLVFNSLYSLPDTAFASHKDVS